MYAWLPGFKRRVRAEAFRCQQSVYPCFPSLATSSPGAGSPQSLDRVLIYFGPCWVRANILQWYGAKKGIWALTTAQIGCDKTPVYSHPVTPTSSIPVPSRGAGFKSGSFLAFLTTNLNFLRLPEVITGSLHDFFRFQNTIHCLYLFLGLFNFLKAFVPLCIDYPIHL